jgi:Ca2+/Na+ antiporter
MTNTLASEYYQEELDFYTSILNTLSKKIKRYSSIRISSFLLGIYGFYLLSGTSIFWLSLYLVLFTAFFLMIVIKQGQSIDKKKETEIHIQILSNELKALGGHFSNFDGGAEFLDAGHPYSNDLDLFGPESVFQMLNRTFSNRGKQSFANKLKTLENDVETILSRQKAIQELAKIPNWIFHFRVLGTLAFQKESTFSPDPNTLANNLNYWLIRKAIFKPSFKIVQIIFPLISFLIFGLFVAGLLSSTWFLLYVILNLGFTARYAKQINQQHQELGKQSNTLFRFQQLYAFLENANFESAELVKIQKLFSCNHSTASNALENLGKIMQAFDTRLNIIAWFILNYFFLWDIRQSLRLEAWKEKYNRLPEQTFSAIAKMEMLCSLAQFQYNRNDLVFPTIETNDFLIEGIQIGHPLISKEIRVDNDILFSSKGQFLIITGANMAGKSTFLRAMGVNLVLALIGAPVCAKEFKTSILKPITSIKTSDSLSANQSYFYTELLRLQQIIEALKTGENYFIILDEILKGTNSKDKEQGSKALVKKLISLNAVGIIATHDLQLAELSTNFPENVRTACFEVEIVNNQLFFDYKLREGVSQNLNATFLMNKMGIS